MKKILILGANEKQIQLIQAAKEEGYYVIACDYTNNNPGIPLLDKHYQVSYLDRDAVLSIAKEEQIDGVVGNNDPAMTMVAYIAEEMGLVGNKPEDIISIVSKSSFRDLQKQAGLYCPKHFETDECPNIEADLEDFKYPIIVKPTLSAGSQGTTKIFSANQTERLYDAFQTCKQLSRNGKVTIEEYVDMPSLEVIEGDVFVMNDEILWNGLFTTRRSQMAPMIPMNYIFPAIISQEKLAVVKEKVSFAFKEAGIRHGEYNIEMYFTKEDELFIIEINPRQGGNKLPQLIFKHSGIDYNKLLVTTAMGDDSYWSYVRNSNAENNFITYHVVFSDYSGLLEKIEISPLVQQYVIDIKYNKSIGEKVFQRRNATDCIAYVTMEFPDRDTQLTYSTEKIEQLIRPIVKDKEFPIVDCSLPDQLIYDFMTGDAYDFFVPKLERVPRTVEGYAEQLATFCTVAYDIDEKSQLKGMVAGYTHNLRIPQWSLIAEVYVNREHRGGGLGEKLMIRYIEYCKSIGMKGVWLHVVQDNLPAQRLYQKLGFTFDESARDGDSLTMKLAF